MRCAYLTVFPCVTQLDIYLSRLPADLEFESVYDGLDLIWSGRVHFCVMKYDSKYKGTDMLFDRHPFISGSAYINIRATISYSNRCYSDCICSTCGTDIHLCSTTESASFRDKI